MKRVVVAVGLGLVWSLAAAAAPPATPAAPRVLDGFDDMSPWKLVLSDQVSGSLRSVAGLGGGRALCLDYDFHDVSGYVGIRRELTVEWPGNYQVGFQLRGDSPSNDLQFKLIDASGDNVWWVNRPGFVFPKAWTGVQYRKRHIDKAWGPGTEKTLTRSAAVEFTLYSKVGGKGTVCFDRLTLQALPPEDTSALTPSVIADTATALQNRIVDGKPDTVWISGGVAEQTISLDLHKVREFGGAVIQWLPGLEATRYTVRSSQDGRSWKTLREVTAGGGGRDWLALPETEARYLRFDLKGGPNWRYGIRDIGLKPLDFADTPNDFIQSVGSDLPRGSVPRGFSGEQPYWTLLGLDGGREQALIGEDGALEVAKSSFSVEPFVLVDNKLLTWADVKSRQSLQDGYLPIASVDWAHDKAALQVTGFVQGRPDNAQLIGRYTLRNPDKVAHEYTLALAVRPWQVNPPTQFLNTVGGFSRIDALAVDPTHVDVNGTPRIHAVQPADAAFATAFDSKLEVMHLASGKLPETREVKDSTGLASGALLYRFKLAPGETREVALVLPQTGTWAMPKGFDAAKAQQQVASMWRTRLDQVKLQVPDAGKPLVDTLRTALAHMLISRIGPSLQPGTRSYSRSWIRDGAMISEGLLRMGRNDAVRDYVSWYAPYQFDNGKVPCCVDARGSDPVPENDSHGELIFNIAEYWRYTGDTAFLEQMWPHVQGAFNYMEQLRLSERTEENRARNPAFYGMMPASISHEGYSAKPMHSYWDNFWALRGYKDAAIIATALGKAEALQMSESRDQFRDDLQASLQAAVALHKIDYLPGSAELGDFDATSTTIALAPGGEQGRLPQPYLDNTFERYWSQFVERRDGKREWKDYTPYEWRNVAAFVRLGWRDRAWQATGFFFNDRAPQAWNQWAEVVSHTPRKPFFVGDLPHAWVASDFVRSALDMFAYNRDLDDSLVLAAGVPVRWLEGKGIAVQGLRTPNGQLNYALSRSEKQLTLTVSAGLVAPPGGVVLPWPYSGEPGGTTINGEPAQWEGKELRVMQLPATVQIDIPAAVRRAERKAP
ncbi:discoidin domain-containing protein [Stenotrophomonas maltophilia]|uniref:Coagulation factor 5/8 type domain-containing protein n=1 Tax=Stenotrophomonas maltophilia TaxID=40324 RepID=A0A4S2D4N2_STEMA|nr:discoidin domain-containing protein [Stenotrophomonas maltophilia]TGY36528.1 coagulation factor 5/8 type domain-containing protein [Stenotrophomonas maltophilia]